MAKLPPPASVKELCDRLSEHRSGIESVFYEAMYAVLYGSRPGGPSHSRTGEVAGLIRFFCLLGRLEAAMTHVLKGTGVKVSFKGVFCHLAGRTGPVVDFDLATSGCELADLLVLVTYGVQGQRTLGNACFLQAKSSRNDVEKGQNSTGRQRKLYEEATDFTFRPQCLPDAAGLGEHRIKGLRFKPLDTLDGYAYWPFRTQDDIPNGEVGLISSTFISPTQVDDKLADIPFPRAMFDLMTTRLGRPVKRAVPDDFGWDRIVRDAVLYSMTKALTCSGGIANVKDLPRVAVGDQHELEALLLSVPALKLNPFDDLRDAMHDEVADRVIKELNNRETLSEGHLKEIFRGGSGGKHGPGEPSDDGDGGGSFLQIHIQSEDDEGPSKFPRRRLRSVDID